MPVSAAARFPSMLSLLVVLGLVVASCTPGNSGSPNASASAGPSGSGSTATGGTVHIGWGGSPDSLNPGDGLLEESYILYELVYDTPVGLDGEGNFVPELATDWTASDDGLTWTLKLVDNATFHDGTPLTSADVKFTLELYRDTADFPYLPSYCDVCESVDAPDPTTVVIHLSDAVGNFESRMAFMYILPKAIWEGVTDPVAFENKEMIGSGPFKLVENVQNDHVTLEANKDYWRTPPNVDGLIFQTIDNPDARVAALTNGDVDMITEFPATAVATLKNTENVKVYIADEFPGSLRDVFFNQVDPDNCPPAPDGKCTGHPALRDVKVRQALATAMDKQQIVDVAKLGLATPGLTLTPLGLGDYYASDVSDYAFNIAAANKLLDDAGYKDTDGDGIRECPASMSDCGKSGNLTFRFNYADDIDSAPREAELLKGMWNQIGVDIQIQGLDPDALTSVCCPAFDYDVMLWGWDSDPDPQFLLGVATCAEIESGFSETGYCNPTYDDLYAAQGIELDHATRVDLVHQMQQILIEDVVYTVPYYPQDVEAFRTDRFSGWLTGPVTIGLTDPASLTVIRPVE
jgi:peptide/nickel transport system substrate-binding protein